ncbi:MAG TPA: glucose-6-phosphate dehydrogenase [Desulfurivibrionaceae bacterium]|nr:glucose-6-phosphate dehydrogenase [Desulfurivibrionaceae bacterium]
MNGAEGAPAACVLPTHQLAPCLLVIFGGTGDLTARKLVPALFNLFLNNTLPHPFAIVGCGRTDLDNDAFRELLRERCAAATVNHPRWPEFAALLSYQVLRYDEPADYRRLAANVAELDQRLGCGGNRLFYLAVPPELYPLIGAGLTGAGLSREEEGGTGWARLVVEKPFGHDLESALELDRVLHRGFQERQIFRIDHFLAKETVQNAIMLRFANGIFEPLWNRNYIEHVGIVAAEELGVESRAGYYEKAGVLRDMFQNHMLQLLAMIAMEPPASFGAERIRDEQVKVFRSLRPFTAEGQPEALALGQYGPGMSGGRPVVGYRQEPGVDADSLTPTFAMMRLYLDNWRWQGVPFYLVSGKRLAHKATRIVIQFKGAPSGIYREVLGEGIGANRLTLGIYPDEEIRLSFQAKVPGHRICLRQVDLDFKYYEDYPGRVLDAYEKVLLDCIRGEQMFFWRQDGVETAWEFLAPLIDICEHCSDRAGQLKSYESGGWGPEPAGSWLRKLME